MCISACTDCCNTPVPASIQQRANSTGVKADVKQMIYITVLCNSRITAELLYNTPPLFIGPYAAANNMALLA